MKTVVDKSFFLSLLKDKTKFQQWQQSNPHVSIDLSGVNLQSMDLMGLNLSRANLQGAILSKAYLRNANLTGASLSGAHLSGASLINVDLTDADISGADLSKAHLSNTNLTRADLSRSYLIGTNLREACLDYANLTQAYMTDADLSNASFVKANLTGADLTNAKALNTNFTEAILSAVCLEDCLMDTLTNLDKVICHYLYLQSNQQQRHPVSLTETLTHSQLIQLLAPKLIKANPIQLQKPVNSSISPQSLPTITFQTPVITHSHISKATQDTSVEDFEMQRGIENQEFILYYQPIVNLKTGFIQGFEALTRWLHPLKGMISPGHFIPLAEKTGLICPLGDYLLRQACLTATSWHNKYPNFDLSITVNFSPRQLVQDNLIAKISTIIEETNCNPNRLVLEITESELIDKIDSAVSILKEIRNLGIRLSIDDFGTGHSSLSRLCDLPINILKIDRSFITKFSQNKQYKNTVKMIITLAKNLGMSVIAEGVETYTQVTQLQQEECQFAQGYFFAKPLNSKVAEAMIKFQPQLLK